MKKFIKSILLFIPFVVTVYTLLVLVWGEFVPLSFKPNIIYGSTGHTYTRLQEASQQSDVDILFLGSSHTYRGFDTRIFERNGCKSFNLGSPFQSPLQTEILLKRYLEQMNPRLVIYEVYPLTFATDGIESSLDLIANDRNDISSVRLALKSKNIKVYNSLLYGFYKDMFKSDNPFGEKMVIGQDTYIPGGYVEKEIEYFRHLTYDDQEWNFRAAQFQAFENIIDMFSERNINYILVQAPITGALYRSYTNNEFFNSIMDRSGIYLNFNELITMNDSLHFFDSHHLNQKGVEIFNNRLINRLYTLQALQQGKPGYMVREENGNELCSRVIAAISELTQTNNTLTRPH
jgi:hypothetical protein